MIYLDYNATTPVDPRVFEAMEPFFKGAFGNASSGSHQFGWEASAAVEKARKQVALTLGAKSSEIYWTSGATESNNMAILGTVFAYQQQNPKTKPHVITSNAEHKAVLAVCEQTQSLGADVTILEVNEFGQVNVDQLAQAIRPNTCLISIMAANNEVGSLNPIMEIGQLAKAKDIWFHCDAAQAAGKIPLNVQELGIDLLSISGHKIYGPKGVGALYVRSQEPRVELEPLQYGGSQERGLRPGTLNVPAIVGLGQALELATQSMASEFERLNSFQKKILQALKDQAPEDFVLNGHPTERLANNLSLSFPNLHSDVFALGLSGLALSSGSACTSESGAPSHVLKALGHSDSLARSTIRIGLGRPTTSEEVDQVIDKILGLIKKNKDISNT